MQKTVETVGEAESSAGTTPLKRGVNEIIHVEFISSRSGSNCFSQHRDAFGDSDVWIFLALKLQGDITSITGIRKNFCDSRIIEIEGVPFATAIISFRLRIDRLRRNHLQLVIRIFHEVAGVHERAEPRRRHGINNSQLTFRSAAEAPMIFQSEDDTALLSFGDAFLNALDAPFEAIIFSMAWKDWFNAEGFHEIVEIFDRVPTAGIESNTWHSEFISNLDAFVGVIDLLLAFRNIGVDEVLMDGQADQIDAVMKCVPL